MSRWLLGAILLAAAGPARADELVPPRALGPLAVELPPDAAPLPAGATLTLLLEIGDEGTVRDVVVERALRPDVDARAVEAARAMRFEPARRDGVPAVARVRMTVTPSPAPPPPGAPSPGSPSAGAPSRGSPSPGSPSPGSPSAGAPSRGAGSSGRPSPGPRSPGSPSPGTPSPGARSPGSPSPAPLAPPASPGPASSTEPPGAPDETYETVVRAPARQPGAASRVVLQGSELTTVPGTFGDPLRVVATLPGVLRSPFGLGYFLVRGASFENTGFLVDGFPVPLLYHLLAGPAVISSRLVERLDFHPGGYPVAYGRFSAGVIALHTAPPPSDRLHLEAEVDLFRAGALAVVPFADGRGTVAVAARRSYYDVFLPLIVDGLDVAYSDYQLRGDLELAPGLDASVFAFASHDALDVSEAAAGGENADDERTEASYAFVRVIGSIRKRFTPGGSLTWRGMVGRDWTRFMQRETGEPDLGGGLDGTYLGQRLELVLPGRSSSLSTTIGADLSATLYDLDTTFPSPRGLGEYPRPDWDPRIIELQSEILQLGAGLYVEHVLRVGPVEMVPGLRLDWLKYGRVSTVVPDPRTVARVRLGEDVVLSASTGLFTQPPTAQRLDPTLGTPTLAPQRSWQSSVGAEITLPWEIDLSPTLFYTRMWQLPRTANLTVGEGGNVERVLYAADGEGGAYGLELMLRRKVDEGLYGWVSYTLSRSERYLEDGPTQPFQFDQTHMLNVAVSYQTGPWRFGARFTLASGRPSPRIVGAVFDADDDDYQPMRVHDGTRLPTYHQLDVRIDRSFRIGPVRASAYLDVINVYYSPNVEGRIYQYDFERSAELPGIPILPTLGIRGELP